MFSCDFFNLSESTAYNNGMMKSLSERLIMEHNNITDLNETIEAYVTQLKMCTSEEVSFYFERKYVVDKYDISIYEWVFWIICLLFLEIIGNFSLLATFVF